MKGWIALADTGRPALAGTTLNLLNVGWTNTQAQPGDDGTWILPEQAVSVFIEVEWNKVNRQLPFELQLVDEDSVPARIGDPEGGTRELVFKHEVVVAPVPHAPNGTPGHEALLVGFATGVILLPAPNRWYRWIAKLDGRPIAETGFWVEKAPDLPTMGGGA